MAIRKPLLARPTCRGGEAQPVAACIEQAWIMAKGINSSASKPALALEQARHSCSASQRHAPLPAG